MRCSFRIRFFLKLHLCVADQVYIWQSNLPHVDFTQMTQWCSLLKSTFVSALFSLLGVSFSSIFHPSSERPRPPHRRRATCWTQISSSSTHRTHISANRVARRLRQLKCLLQEIVGWLICCHDGQRVHNDIHRLRVPATFQRSSEACSSVSVPS